MADEEDDDYRVRTEDHGPWTMDHRISMGHVFRESLETVSYIIVISRDEAEAEAEADRVEEGVEEKEEGEKRKEGSRGHRGENGRATCGPSAPTFSLSLSHTLLIRRKGRETPLPRVD